MKKKKSNILKKPVFHKFFFKRLGLYLLIAVAVGAAVTMVAEHFYNSYMSNKLNLMEEEMITRIQRSYDWYYGNEETEEANKAEKDIEITLYGDLNEEEKEEQFYTIVADDLAESWMPMTFALLDVENFDILAQSPYDTIFLTICEEGNGQEDAETDDQLVWYYCKDANIKKKIQVAYDTVKCEGIPEISFYMKDCYIKDFTFVPGEIIITEGEYSPDESKNKVLNRLDFTPSDVSGYTHIIKGENDKNLQIIGPTWTHLENNELPDILLEFLNLEDWKKDIKDNGPTIDKLGTVFYNNGGEAQYSLRKITFGTDEEAKDYWLLSVGTYNLLKDWTNQVVMSYVALLFVVIVAAWISSYTSYMKQKSFYEMDQYRRNLTNTMAHDLKSPLMVISGFAENLLEQELPDKSKHFTSSIVENVQYMNQIIEKVLELSRVENMDYKLQREQVDLKEISRELTKNYKSQLEEKGLEIQMTGECILNADKICMTQVLDNLISNAVKYTREGSVIEIHLEDKRYEIANASAVELEMDAKELLNPFVKGDNSRSGKQGSGIGLTIARNLVEKHGYQLELEYDEGIFRAVILI